ncbi:MAG: 3'-5' exonuclease, partial [Bacteroidota bacterium]
DIQSIRPLVSLDEETLRTRAGMIVEEALDDYSAFQVQTIDSFLARVFKASALELGFTPDFEILLDSRPLLSEAFEAFARGVGEGTESAGLLTNLIDLLPYLRGSTKKYAWNPYADLARNVKDLYQKLIQASGNLSKKNYAGEMQRAGETLRDLLLKLDKAIDASGLTKAQRFVNYVAEARLRKFDRLIELKFADPPFTKSATKAYKATLDQTEDLRASIVSLRAELITLRARSFFQPYVRTHEFLQQTLDQIRRQQGKMFIGDVANKLARSIERANVPEIYFNLGEKIHHYLIDEFQDTSPIQWKNLEPLIAESLSGHGSLFVVGDMKQSIYSFRGADWRIMKRITDEEVFPSVRHTRKDLPLNYRTKEHLVRFNEDIFRNIVPLRVPNGAAQETGLASLHQEVPKEAKDKGYVETVYLEGNTDTRPERAKILEIIQECRQRGHSLRDIAVLTPENQDVVQVSGWLNEGGIEFIPYSTLDIRTRKVVGELLALLRFLDSPIDDLAFATFLLGDVFSMLLQLDRSKTTREHLRRFVFNARPSKAASGALYVKFRAEFADLWNKYFDELFGLAGYVPLYDLASDVLKITRAFEIAPKEEAALLKLLEVVMKFEERGENSLKEFVGFAESAERGREADWNIEVPPDVDAVRIMTVHKAKGLGFRVVIVLLYDVQLRRNRLFMQETKEGIELIRLVADETEEAPELAALFQEKDLQERVDQLNKLYVALTRAEDEMYVVSVKYEKATEPSSFFPETGYEPSQKPVVSIQPLPTEETVNLFHHSIRQTRRNEKLERIAFEETKRGELIHRILARVHVLETDIPETVNKAVELEKQSGAVFDEKQTSSLLRALLTTPGIKEFFLPSRAGKVLNEQEFVTSDGQLYRMDRVMVQDSKVTVLDYKTGEESEEHGMQVLGYMAVLKGVYPGKAVEGFLVYVDRKIVRGISEEMSNVKSVNKKP